MADKANKHKDNVAGAWYVDTQCTFCQLCNDTAPDFFKAADDHTFVGKQPSTPDEKALCQQALEACPVQAIGDDGA